MKNTERAVLISFFVCLFFLSCLFSCASLKETKLKENPDFEKNAIRYVITSPLSHRSSVFNHFILEDPRSGSVYEIRPQVGSPLADVSLLGRKTTSKKDLVHTKEISTYYFSMTNPLDHKTYDVAGEITFYRSREEKASSSFESGEKVYPIEFLISEDGNDAGKFTVNEPGFSNVLVETLFHGKSLKLEYQSIANKDGFSFEDDSGLVALIGLKPKGVIATRKTGELFIKRTLAPDEQSDIVSLYVIAETVFSILDETGL